MTALEIAPSEFILGGQKSGKSRRAECLAQAWLHQSTQHEAVLIATAQPWDSEMTLRIARHKADRTQRLPRLRTVEEPHELAATITLHSAAQTLLVVDCLTLWLTNLTMPYIPSSNPALDEHAVLRKSVPYTAPLPSIALLAQAITAAPGPLVLVGNEIGLGVIPMGAEVRAFVDHLGILNQTVAATCVRVTLMAAGLPLTLKDTQCI